MAIGRTGWAAAAGAVAVAAVAAALLLATPRPERRAPGLTVSLPQAVGDIPVTPARVPGRPIVVIDAGHGGQDPGAISVSGKVQEKSLALALSTELRDLLAERGRVRVAMTRADDRTLTLEQRANVARRLGAGLFVSIHMDHAPNPLARGVTVYSLSDVASTADAARFAAVENRAVGGSGEAEGPVAALLADLDLRGQMEDSAALAERIVRRAAGPVQLRPTPHQFAAFHVLRTAAAPAVLVEAGYISNADDEAALVTREGRAPIVKALAQAIEADLAVRR